MNKKILNLLVISSCAMFSVAANYDELSPLGLQNNTTNTPKHLPTKPLMPSTTPEIEEKLKAPEYSKQQIQKLNAILNGKILPSEPNLIFTGMGLTFLGFAIGEFVNGSAEHDLIPAVAAQVAVGVACLVTGYVGYQKDIEIAKMRLKDLIEKTNEINKFYEENSKNSN